MKILRISIKNCHKFDRKMLQLILITKPQDIAIIMPCILIKNCHELNNKMSNNKATSINHKNATNFNKKLPRNW